MKLIIAFLLALTSFCFSQDFWEQTNHPNCGQIESLVIDTSSGNIYTSTYCNCTFRSTDNGDSWIQINEGLTGFYC